MQTKKIATILIVVLTGVVVVSTGVFILTQKKGTVMSDTTSVQDQSTQSTQSTQSIPEAIPTKVLSGVPPMMIDVSKSYTAILHTDKGDITIQLHAKETPITVNNFVTLSKNRFYDGTIFHRVLKGFMIQGGDPEGTGMGGPGYKFDDEKFSGEYTRGTVAMANAGTNTNGSQFFIMHGDTPLPKNYVIFGSVTSGLDVVDAIATADVSPGDSGEQSKPVKPVKIMSIDVTEM